MKEFDKDRSGKVEFKEFVRIMSKRAREEKKMKTKQEFEDAFKASALVQMYLPEHINRGYFRCLTEMEVARSPGQSSSMFSPELAR